MTGNLSKEEITAIFTKNVIGRIGCSADGATYIVPVSYVFMGDYVLCHSYEGKKIGMMRKNPAVCLEVDEIDDYNNWRCIIAEGRYEELTDSNDINEARQQFSALLQHVKMSETSLPPEERRNYHTSDGPRADSSVYYMIRIGAISGRFEKS